MNKKKIFGNSTEISQYYKDLLTENKFPMAIFDSHLSLVAFSKAFLNELSFTKDNIAKYKFDDIIVEKNANEHLLTRLLKIGNMRRYEGQSQLLKGDGGFVEKNVEVVGVFNEKGVLKETILILDEEQSLNEERNEREKQQRLLSSEELYRMIFEKTSDGIIIFDLEKMIPITCNTRALELYKCDFETFISKSPLDFSPEYQSNGILSSDLLGQYVAQAKEDRTINFDWECLASDSSPFLCEFTGFVLTGSKSYIVLVFKDITEKRLIEERRKELERKEAEAILKEERRKKDKIESGYREILSNSILSFEKENILLDVISLLDKLSVRLGPEERRELIQISKTLQHTIDFSLKWEKIQYHFERVYPGFLTQLKKKHPVINSKGSKLCAYVLLGLTSKEIAQLRNVRPNTVDMSKYRMKLALKISKDKSLYDYLYTIWLDLMNK